MAFGKKEEQRKANAALLLRNTKSAILDGHGFGGDIGRLATQLGVTKEDVQTEIDRRARARS